MGIINMKDLISIIVPVYNLEKYIARCLISLINQTYDKIEIICVNDGSIDNSLEVLKFFKNKDERIKIINQKNQGVSQARNNALNYATGKYIMFVDGDDWLSEETCKFAIDTVNSNNVDVVLWSYIREYGNKSLTKDVFKEDSRYFDKKEVYKKIYRRIFGLYKEEMMRPDHGDSIVPVWGKLYKADIIKKNHIQFIDYKEVAAEDALFNMKYFSFVNSAYYEKKYYYHYRKNDTSLTRSYNPNLERQWNNLIINMENEIDSLNLDNTFLVSLNNRRCLSLIPLGLNALYAENKKIEIIRNILNNNSIKKTLASLEFKYLPLQWKIFFYAAKYQYNFIFYCLLKAIYFITH